MFDIGRLLETAENCKLDPPWKALVCQTITQPVILEVSQSDTQSVKQLIYIYLLLGRTFWNIKERQTFSAPQSMILFSIEDGIWRTRRAQRII